MTGIQLCLRCSTHPVHCRAVLIYWLFTLSLEKKAHRDTEGPENQHASFSTIPPKTAFCQIVLWTECVFFKFMCKSPTAKVHCFEKGSDFTRHGLQSTRILCPWDFSDKNTGLACCSILQGVFQTQG